MRVVVGNQRPVDHDRVSRRTARSRTSATRSVQAHRSSIPTAATVDCNQVRLEFKLGHDTHAHELSNATGCEGEFTLTGVDGHGVDANIFTVITANYTDAGNGPAAPVTGSAEVILQPKLKQAEYFATTGRTADGRGTGDPGVATETTTDVGGGLAAAFIEDGDWISFNPYNLEDLSKVTFRVASGGAGGIIELRYDAADGPLVAETPNIAPTGGWQTWRDVTIDLPATIPQGTHRLFVVFRHPTATGSLMNLNYFKFTGKGAAVTAPPEVTATAEPRQRRGAAERGLQRHGDRRRERGDDLRLGLRRPRHRHRHLDPGGPELHLHGAGQLHGHRHGDRRLRRQVDGLRRGPRHAAARRVPDRPGPLGRVRRHGARPQPLDRACGPTTANPFSVSDGNLNLPIANGSMYGPGTSAKNIIVQDDA